MSIEDRAWRFHPFDRTLIPQSRTEYHTVTYLGFANLYGIRTEEGVLKDQVTSVTIKEVTNANPNSPIYGRTFAEIDRVLSPAPGQFRVDYDTVNADLTELSYYGTGIVEVHPGETGVMLEVSYQATGLIVAGSLFVTVDGAQTIAGTKSFSGELQIEGGANIASGFRLEHSGTPVAGYYDDGTPFFIRRITGTTDGGGNLELNHGIADYAKIQNVRARIKNTPSLFYLAHQYVTFPVTVFNPSTIYWTATKVRVFGALASEEIVVLVEYIN